MQEIMAEHRHVMWRGEGTGWVTVCLGLGWAWHGGKLKRHALSLM